MRKFVPVVVLAVLATCGYDAWDSSDRCRSYSRFRCSQLESQTYNVYFWYPNNERENYLGQAKGLSGCGSVAHSHALQKQVHATNWSYICCLKTSDSSCAEKHR